MPFNQKPQKFNAKINEVTIGSGDKTVTIGKHTMKALQQWARSLRKLLLWKVLTLSH